MFGCSLIINKDEVLRESLEVILAAEGYNVLTACCAESALEIIENSPIDVVFCDLEIQGIDGFDLIPQIVRLIPGLPIILMSAHDSEDLASEAIRRGAFAYLANPFQTAKIRLTLGTAYERRQLRRKVALLERDISRCLGDQAIVAASDDMIALLELLERIAAYKSTILVTGERGTGKEVIARAIHSQSPRREAPFVAVQCGALPENLLESEIFGHGKGTFSGARRSRRGLFAEADGGSLFLDEISKLPASLQLKLVGAIQQEEIQSVGGAKSRKVDVRVMAATSRDLALEVREGRFREDLFDRLEAGRLEVPALRDRRQDLPLLVDHFLSRFRDQLGNDVRGVSDEALDLMLAYRWPGNVRELENMIERAMILTDGDTIEVSSLPATLRATAWDAALPDGELDEAEDFSLKRARQACEARTIRRALQRTGGNRTHAAKRLEISHRALLYKLKDYGIRD